jgi:hypothetical protein
VHACQDALLLLERPEGSPQRYNYVSLSLLNTDTLILQTTTSEKPVEREASSSVEEVAELPVLMGGTSMTKAR